MKLIESLELSPLSCLLKMEAGKSLAVVAEWRRKKSSKRRTTARRSLTNSISAAFSLSLSFLVLFFKKEAAGGQNKSAQRKGKVD